MNTNMNIKRLPVDMLKPAKYNPRKNLKPGDPAYEKIKASLKAHGYVDPVIWNEVTGNIVGGHHATRCWSRKVRRRSTAWLFTSKTRRMRRR